MSSLIKLDSFFDILDYIHVDDMTALKKISKNLGTCILDILLMLNIITYIVSLFYWIMHI